MDELRRHATPFVDRWWRLARRQRIAVTAVLVASVVGFSVLLKQPNEVWQPIADGREFSTAELASIQSAWRQAGLTSFRRDARKLLVPLADMDRYTAAIPKLSRDSNDSGNEQGFSLAKANFFTSHEQLEQLKDNDLRTTLRRHLKAIPAIAEADVIWARSKARSAFASRSKVTATINVLPNEGHDLTPQLAQSLRTAVAGMVPDLCAEDIVVLDQSTGLAVTDDSEPLIAEQQRHRQQERLARQFEARIAAALAHIPNAVVKVNPARPPLTTNRHFVAKPTFGSTITWTTDSPNNLVDFASMSADNKTSSWPSPKEATSSSAWQVALQIPQAYFDAQVAQHFLSTEHRMENPDDLSEAECARLRLLVQNLLPFDASLAGFSMTPLATDSATVAPPVSFAAWPHVGLGLFAVLCLAATALRKQQENVRQPSRCVTEQDATNTEFGGKLSPLLPPHENDGTSVPTPSTESLTDLAHLQQLHPQSLANALRQERPQAIAVLLTRFPSRIASACLSEFAPALQTDVIRRLKSLGDVPDELVMEIARTVSQRIAPISEEAICKSTNRIAHLLPETRLPRAVA